MSINTRIENILGWCILMFESVLYLIIPSSICIPYSSRYVIDTRKIDLASLNERERYEVCYKVIFAGFASIATFSAFGFGKLGQFGPGDTFKSSDRLAKRFLDFRQQTTCSICLEPLVPPTIIKEMTRCNHVFHEACVEEWLQRKSTCPLCRCTQ